MSIPNPALRRQELYALLGELPPRERPLAAQTVKIEERDGYVLETLSLDLNGSESAPAYFARPRQLAHPLPTVLYHHAHGGQYQIGKEEFITHRDSLQNPPYAKALTDLGYCALCVDTWNFGERRGRSESELFKEMLWRGQVLWGMMVYDSLRAVDYLVTRPEVDAQRLGTLGLSMGSTMAWWLAALDERIKVCVDICCLTDYEELIATRGLDGHGIYYYVPGLLKHFSTSEINALIAPRAHLALAGNYDRLTPPRGLDRIDATLRATYAALGVPERWKLRRYDTGHFETAHGRAAILDFLQAFL
jgi:dienelactone hydrolase